ncbi:MAG TPA: tetratricopeptide repeat protein [Bryobacteraceae bacterium]|jgi:Flp pilus assembly protein TadD
MKAFILLLSMAALGFGEAPDPLVAAYQALKSSDYDHAIPAFLQAIAAHPDQASIRKDLAYTYLKTGESEAARDQFGEAMRLDPSDVHAAMEYAYLCYESRDEAIVWKATARRIFDRLRKQGNADAERAFQNIDQPLAAGIARWKLALQASESYSAHYELAQLAELRDQLDVAVEHYRRAWQLQPKAKYVLVDLGRVLMQANRPDEGRAALLAASRGGETRAAELAREALPDRYPYVYEFRDAIKLDPSNVVLHRELAYLLLKMSETVEAAARSVRQSEAEDEFRIIVASSPNDLQSCAQLGFLYLSHKDTDHAMPLLKRVMDGEDKDLANKVRTALHLEPVLEKRAQASDPAEVDARVMAQKSYEAGYMKDALKYLTLAHESDPDDYSVMLKLGYTHNMLHDDASAIIWFKLAQNSPDLSIAHQARRAFANLRPNLSRVRTTVWMYPFYSTRWDDNFAYGQIKTELRWKGVPVHPYASIRFIGDTRENAPGPVPGSLSESAFIFAGGLATDQWHGATFWGEAGTAVSYLGAPREKDVRGGVAWGKLWGSNILSKVGGGFFESNADGVFISRFGDDTLAVVQNKAGYTIPPLGRLHSQAFLNLNATQDSLRQYWANYVEAGPGMRFHLDGTPPSLVFAVNLMRGAYTDNQYNPRRPNFYDVRAGFWYAFTR